VIYKGEVLSMRWLGSARLSSEWDGLFSQLRGMVATGMVDTLRLVTICEGVGERDHRGGGSGLRVVAAGPPKAWCIGRALAWCRRHTPCVRR
jgi:hypothetical protein